jgi:nucleoside-diphosphate-sugar epimerase
MTSNRKPGIRADCLLAISKHSTTLQALAGQRIAITGGTGFLGSWIAETVLTLNDEFKLNIRLDVLASNATGWAKQYPHLGAMSGISIRNQDVRAPFELSQDVSYVIHAAGIPDGRVHSSDPLRVFQTTVIGASNALEAASKLPNLNRFVNVSSGLVYGSGKIAGALDEDTFFPDAAGQVSSVYSDSKRSSESLCAVYRSQMRIPTVTIRPFTFVGPYQDLHRPWALNNFLRDALSSREIRVHGDGDNRRSYLYGSDAACWTLGAMLKGSVGRAYNVGSEYPISLKELAEKIAQLAQQRPSIRFRTVPAHQLKHSDFFPSTTRSRAELGVCETVDISEALERTIAWYATN